LRQVPVFDLVKQPTIFRSTHLPSISTSPFEHYEHYPLLEKALQQSELSTGGEYMHLF